MSTRVPSPAIFKAYDIRGIYPDQLDEAIAYRIGASFVRLVPSKKVIVGRDMRTSSPALHASTIQAVTGAGVDVLDIGLVSTDMFYYACGSTGLPGITVTASHNPPAYNGFKMVKKMPEMVSGGNGMEDLYRLAAGPLQPEAGERGSVSALDIHQGYREKLLSIADTGRVRPCKIVVDPSNGTGGIAFDLASEGLPIDLVRMCYEPDGTFPNHGGDPLQEENRRDLQARVVREGADLGFAFDPDADRFFVIDGQGRFVPGDFMTALLGRYMVEKNGGGTIVYDTRASWAVKELVEGAGGTAIEMRIGHAYVKAKMQETGALFAGEVTGHYYFKDFYLGDSGVLPALLLLEMLGHYQCTLTELLEPLRAKYFLSGEINTTVRDPDAVIAEIEKTYKSTHNTYKIDGITVAGHDWHANVRKSNTEPLVRLNVEGLSPEKMEEMRDIFLEVIRR